MIFNGIAISEGAIDDEHVYKEQLLSLIHNPGCSAGTGTDTWYWYWLLTTAAYCRWLLMAAYWYWRLVLVYWLLSRGSALVVGEIIFHPTVSRRHCFEITCFHFSFVVGPYNTFYRKLIESIR